MRWPGAGLLCFAILVAALGCSSSAPNRAPDRQQGMRLVTDTHGLAVELTADDQVLDRNGHALGAFDAKAGIVTIAAFGLNMPLAQIVLREGPRSFVLELPVGHWTIAVGEHGELTADGERFGRIEGFDGTRESLRRVEALCAARTVAPASPDAAPPPDAWVDPDPPPPPPPPAHPAARDARG
jgi:hypothetical protein